jgi:hypothetical protein
MPPRQPGPGKKGTNQGEWSGGARPRLVLGRRSDAKRIAQRFDAAAKWIARSPWTGFTRWSASGLQSLSFSAGRMLVRVRHLLAHALLSPTTPDNPSTTDGNGS